MCMPTGNCVCSSLSFELWSWAHLDEYDVLCNLIKRAMLIPSSSTALIPPLSIIHIPSQPERTRREEAGTAEEDEVNTMKKKEKPQR
jgi:hypothetical protein